jgi:hypothetical protein
MLALTAGFAGAERIAGMVPDISAKSLQIQLDPKIYNVIAWPITFQKPKGGLGK